MDPTPAWMTALRRMISGAAGSVVAATDPVQPTFGTVKQLNPLRIALDTDPTTTLPYAPPCLDYPTFVGQRVWVQSYGRRLVIVGVSKTAPDTPVGSGSLWWGPNEPEMPWMSCQGQTMSRSAYPELFAAIGTTFGAPDANSFSLPNAQGRVIAGCSSTDSDFGHSGKTGGEKAHTLTAGEIPAHGGHIDGYTGTLAAYLAPGGLTSYTDTAHGWKQYRGNEIYPDYFDVGGGGSHNNLPPYLVAWPIIKVR